MIGNGFNNREFIYYNDKQTCADYVQSIAKSETIFLISTASCAIEILSLIHSLRQLDSVFLFSTEEDYNKYEYLFDEYSKVIGIVYELPKLFQSIEENIDLAIKQIESFQFYEQKQKSTRELSKEAGSFLWLRLFKDVVLNLPHDEQAKQDMINRLKEHYHNNSKQLKLIAKFNSEYNADDALRWYSGQPFLYKQLNRALRTEDIELLYAFRYFIADLCKSLAKEYQIIKESFDSTITFYRGVKLSNEEVKKIKNNVGKLISTNGFLSTSIDRNVALAFVGEPTDNEVSILFEIECSLDTNETVIMAMISQYSLHPQEQEVLFDLDAAFELLSVTEDESSPMTIVKMRATNEGSIIAQEHIEHHRKYMSTSGVVLLFGYLLAETGEYDKCQKYFECLLKNPNGDNISFIYYYMGVVHSYKCEYEKALQYYEQAYEMMMNSVPQLLKASSFVLNDIGSILQIQGQYDVALDHHMRALKIRQDYVDYINMAVSLANIAVTYNSKGEFQRALNFFMECLHLREQYLPNEHKETASVLSNIGLVFNHMDQLDTSLEYQYKSLEMNEKCLPPQHENIALCLYRIALVLTNKGKYDDALDYHIRALKIRESIFPNGHIKISNALNNIGFVYYSKKDYVLTLDYLKKSLEMRERLMPNINDAGLLNTLTYFGLTYTKLREHNDALMYHTRALKVSQSLFHIGHGKITDCLTNIGIAFRELKDYKHAFEYFEKASKNEELNTTKPNLFKLARIYDNMGICLCSQDDDMSNGLSYRMKAVRIIEKLSPCIQYAQWIDSIGNIFFEYEKYDNALECYLTSLNIRVQCLPTDHIDIAENFMHIADVYIEKEKIKEQESTGKYQTKALFFYESALEIYRKWKHPNVADVINKIVSVNKNTN
ncbi:unnamed protein product [Rotaria sordida]|uniref:ADP ribosyltransferase domain-containing protein n=1 Tax=Rotaria sordida TaxID=392033 RepID=A0A814YQR5_9BILA|nr:unnamed protein product [Rotaria sordida]CAF1514655.1 unnamed protein product [Rotaria sordida]